MKNIYVLDIFETQITGFTTYKEVFFACLSGCDEISLNHIIFHYPTDEFTVVQTGKVREFRIPAIKISDFSELALIAGRVLNLYIEDKPENIFVQHSAPSYATIAGIKVCFPLSKVIYVIHDFIWATYLLGNAENFQKVVTRNIECPIFDLIDKVYKDGLHTFEVVDKIVCLSDDTFQLLHSFYQVRKDKLAIIPNGLEDVYQPLSVDRKEQLKKEVCLEGCKIILYVGRVKKQKGGVDLLKGVERVIEKYSECKLVMAGNVDVEVLAGIKDTVRPNVLFLGMLSKVELYKWYQIADIGVIPSFYEQCSYAGIEMKMFHLPVVASDGFGVKNMFDKNNSVPVSIDFTPEGRYPDRLAEALLQVLSSEEVRMALGNASRKDFSERYRTNRMKENYLSLFSSVN